ncbi:MAG: DUF362 domain-containing protein [Planctomycetota bacterium]|jgi:uncharacterized Fe-S center protein|nr:DUF362 domain-containing protein [Planctomycetota bacterium]
MTKSPVHFTDLRVAFEENRQQKLARLIKAAGMGDIDFKRKFAAIKIHFGELGNLAFLRPNYAKTVADLVKEFGGKPFLTDCNTLYVGSRKNALEHIETAYLNGFSPFSTGCHVLIGDGLKGTDEVLVPVENGEWVKEAKIGRAVMDADVFISLTHFKCHEAAGIGGALKNIGMGCGSRAGKMEMHSAGKPSVNSSECVGCGRCARVCAHAAAVVSSGKAFIDHDRCVGCGRCLGVCPADAVEAAGDESNAVLNRKIAEYAAAVLAGRPHFHIALVMDVSPYCDCHGENDVAVVPDIGMFAAFDPVALDLACAEAVNRQPVAVGSLLDRRDRRGGDHFTDLFPDTDWRLCVEHAAKLGLGNLEYELVKM